MFMMSAPALSDWSVYCIGAPIMLWLIIGRPIMGAI